MKLALAALALFAFTASASDQVYYHSAEDYAYGFMLENCKDFKGDLVEEQQLDGDDGYELILFQFKKGWIEVVAQEADQEVIEDSEGFITESYSTSDYRCTGIRD